MYELRSHQLANRIPKVTPEKDKRRFRPKQTRTKEADLNAGEGKRPPSRGKTRREQHICQKGRRCHPLLGRKVSVFKKQVQKGDEKRNPLRRDAGRQRCEVTHSPPCTPRPPSISKGRVSEGLRMGAAEKEKVGVANSPEGGGGKKSIEGSSRGAPDPRGIERGRGGKKKV